MSSRFFKNYDRYKITYRFGTRVIFGKSEYHSGVDLVAIGENGGAVSDWVVAFDSGEVIEAGVNARSGYYCKIRHDETLVTLFCHFKNLQAQKGAAMPRVITLKTVNRRTLPM